MQNVYKVRREMTKRKMEVLRRAMEGFQRMTEAFGLISDSLQDQCEERRNSEAWRIATSDMMPEAVRRLARSM